jgi:hypothetical protein
LLPYGASGYSYEVVPSGAVPGFPTTYDSSGFALGTAPFSNGARCGYLSATGWPENTDLLATHSVDIPPGASGISISVAIDNDIVVYWDGTEILPKQFHDGCASYDSFTWDVPQALSKPGTHQVAFRAIDRGAGTFFDATVRAAQTGWRPVGPGAYNIGNDVNNGDANQLVTGRVTAIAPDPATPGTLLVGAQGGGVWRGTGTEGDSGGGTWTPLSDELASLSVGSLARDPTNPNVIYVGTGEQGAAEATPPGAGIFVSQDGGTTWHATGPLPGGGSWDGTAVSGLAIDRGSSGHVLAATDVGLLASLDGGSSWSQLLPGHWSNVIQDPSTPNWWWASSVSGENRSSCGASVWLSTNGGRTFTNQFRARFGRGPFDAGAGLGVGTRGWVYVATSDCKGMFSAIYRRTPPRHDAWLGIADRKTTAIGARNDKIGGIFGGFGGFGQGNFDNVVAVDPSHPCQVIFGGVSAWTTSDGCSTTGRTSFRHLSTLVASRAGIHNDFHALAYTGPDTLFAGTDGGIYRIVGATTGSPDVINLNGSPSGGSCSSPESSSCLDIAQFYAGQAYDATHLAGGAQDDGTPGRFGASWQACDVGDGGYTEFVPSGTGMPAGAFLWETDIQLYGGVSCGDTHPGLSPGAGNIPCGIGVNPTTGSIQCSGQPVQSPDTPFVINPTDPNQIAYATDHLYTTSHGGNGAWAQTCVVLDCFRGNEDYVSALTALWSSANRFLIGTFAGAVMLSDGSSADDITGDLPQPGTLPGGAIGAPGTTLPGVPWVTGIAYNPCVGTNGCSTDNHEAWVSLAGVGYGAVYHTENYMDGSSTHWTNVGTFATPVSSLTTLATPATVNGQLDTTRVTVLIGTANMGVDTCTTCYGADATGGPGNSNWDRVGDASLPSAWVSDVSCSADMSTIFAWTYGRGVWTIPFAGATGCVSKEQTQVVP